MKMINATVIDFELGYILNCINGSCGYERRKLLDKVFENRSNQFQPFVTAKSSFTRGGYSYTTKKLKIPVTPSLLSDYLVAVAINLYICSPSQPLVKSDIEQIVKQLNYVFWDQCFSWLENRPNIEIVDQKVYFHDWEIDRTGITISFATVGDS